MIRLAGYTALVILTIASLALVWLFREPIVILVLAIVVAASLRPSIDRLVRYKLPRGLALALTYLLLAIGIIALVLLVSGPLLIDLQRLGAKLALTYEEVATRWPESTNQFQRTLASRLPSPQLLYQALSGQTDVPIVQQYLALVADVGSLVGKTAMVLILSLYWNIDHVRFERMWLTTLPVQQRVRARRLWRALENGVGAYVRRSMAQVILTGLVLWIGFAALGLRYAALLAVVGGLVQLVPWLGILLAVIPVVLVGLISGPVSAAVAGAYTVVVTLVFELFVEPRFFSRAEYSSVLLMVVAIVLSLAAGLPGLILAPPLTATIQILWTHLVDPLLQDRHETDVEEPADLDESLSVLRESLDGRSEPEALEQSSLLDRLDELITATREL